MIKEVTLNRPQFLVHLINANKTYCLWGRGTGKSNGAEGPRIMHLFNTMPKAQIGLIVPSYEMGYNQILTNIIGFWQNEMGLVEGEDYVVGRKPPEDWEKPIIPIVDNKNCISFSNGSVMPIISLRREASANGFNMQAVVGDEAKFFKEPKLKEVIRAIRGGYREFGHLAEFQSQWYFTDKYDGDIHWLLKKRELQNIDLIKSVIATQLHVNKLQQNPIPNKKEIDSLTKLLTNIRKSLVYVSEASATENKQILGEKFFTDQKENATENEYNVAILNQDPSKVENSFYPNLSESHYYTAINDVDKNKPLMLAADYQWRISPIVAAQYGPLPGATTTTLNYVYSCHVLAPLGLTDAIDKWCAHFATHNNKLVYYLFDKTAVGKSPTTKPYYQVVKERLEFNGWRVVPLNMGEPPRHDDKFKMVSKHLTGASHKPHIRINAATNEQMIKSINLSPAIQYNGKTSKDKKSEGNLAIPAQETTHYSDVFDMILYAANEINLVPQGNSTSFGSVIA